MASKPDSDSHLVRALRLGDHHAFEKLFSKYAQKLFVFSVSYLKNEDEAEELVQEVFMKIWARRTSIKPDTSFQSYLFTIAYNSIKKSFNRKARNDQFKHDLIDALDTASETGDFEQNYQLVIEKLEQFISEMPEKRREVFLSRKKDGKPVKQIAEEMGVSLKTVENQITEAMNFLRRKFEEEHPGGFLFFTFLREV